MDLLELNNLLEDHILQLRAAHTATHNMKVDVCIRNRSLLADVSGYTGGPTSSQKQALNDTLVRLQHITVSMHHEAHELRKVLLRDDKKD